MKLASWNVNSVRMRLPRLLTWLTQHSPDVLCLQETKVRDDAFPRAEIEAAGYRVVARGQPTYNGVAVLSREPAHEVARTLGVNDEARFLDVEVGGVRVLCCYVPNGREVGTEHFAGKLRWLGELGRYLDRELRPSQPVVVCGDFNVAPEPIDVYDPEGWDGEVLFHPDERKALREIVAWGLVDAVRELHPGEAIYSWWDYRQLSFPKNYGLRIDHVFVSEALKPKLREAFVDRNARKGKQPSDHAPVVMTVAT